MSSKKRSTTANKSASATNMDLAAVVSDRVQIQGLIVVESSSKRQAGVDLNSKGVRYDIDHTDIGVGTHPDGSGVVAVVSVRMTFEARDDRQSGEPLFSIEAKYAILYKIDDMTSIKNENLEAFASLNGVFNVWPYWRDYVQNAAARMGLFPPPIPVYRYGRGRATTTALKALDPAKPKGAKKLE